MKTSKSTGCLDAFICVRAAPDPKMTDFCSGCAFIHVSTALPAPFGKVFISPKSSGFFTSGSTFASFCATSRPASNLIAFPGANSGGVGALVGNARATLAGTGTFGTPFEIAPMAMNSPAVLAGAVVAPCHTPRPISNMPSVAAAGSIPGLRAIVSTPPGIMPAISTAAAGPVKAIPYPSCFTCSPAALIGLGIAAL